MNDDYLTRLERVRPVVLGWSEPPPGGRWKRCIEELKRRPGEWAHVLSGANENTAWGSSGRLLKTYGAEVRVRKIDGEGWSVWARWPEDA